MTMQQHEKTASAKLVLSFGELVLRSIPIVKDNITIGRRPYNDIALDDLTVSGEHAVILGVDGARVIKDLNSRNGTYVNGDPLGSHHLEHGDLIEVGIYRLRYLVEQRPVGDAGAEDRSSAFVEWLTGAERGNEQVLARPIVAITGAGQQIAVVARRRNGHFLTHLEGLAHPLVNGESIGLSPRRLEDGDLIELSGTMLRFRLKAR